MQLYVHLTDQNVAQAFDRLKNCLYDIKMCFSTNKLKCNPDKTKGIMFGSRTALAKLGTFFPS